VNPFVIHYGEPPPSSNHIYFNLPGHGRRLTRLAEVWARRYTAWVGQRHLFSIQSLRDHLEHGGVLNITITVLLLEEDLLNKGWLSMTKAGKRKAKSRYKRVDVTNRIKLIEDTTADLLGVKDECNFCVTAQKLISENRGVMVTIIAEDPRVYGVPDEYLQ
jgi:hypothetical protein